MDVELLDNNSGVLDLTGGSNNEPTKEPETEQDTTVETEGTVDSETEVDGEQSTDSQETEGSDTDDGSSETDSVDADSTDAPELYFNGEQVEVEVPDEVANALKEAGVEANDVVSQLFKKDGKFSLDEETYQKLTDKFGKVMVDGYLNLYKQQNENTMKVLADKEASEKATEEQHGKEYAEAVGGKEGLEKLEGYILDNFDDNQIAAYNAVMESGDHASQLLIISQVRAQMELQDKLVNGDKKVNLLGDEGSQDNRPASPLDKGYLTADEYQELIDAEKYWTDSEYMARVDAARTVGIRKQV